MKRAAILLFTLFLSSPVFANAEYVPDQLAALTTSSIPGVPELSLLLNESFHAYEGVQDYKAVFLKQEESQGALGEQETLFLKFEKPFKIFLHWFDTHRKGLQVLYERGKHDGKLAIHQPGLLLGLAPVIFLEQSSPWVSEGSESHDIEDAGIGNFLYDLGEAVAKGAEEGKLAVKMARTNAGTNADISFPGSSENSVYFASRIEAFFDAETKLPVCMKLYDWNGKVTGIYEYKDLKLNVGAADPEFKKIAQRALYKLFVPPVKVIRQNNFSARNSP